MWLFTKHGFVSIVENLHNPETLLERARVRKDLENFVETLKAIDGKDRWIAETPAADYGYRIVAEKGVVADAVAASTRGIDYSNFKNAVHGDPSRDNAYFEVWAAMRELQ